MPNRFIKDGVTYTGNTITQAHQNYKDAQQSGQHLDAKTASKASGHGDYPEGTPKSLQYTKLPQHHLNANDKKLAASSAQKGSPLKNMLK